MQLISLIYFYIIFLDDMFRESCSHHQVWSRPEKWLTLQLSDITKVYKERLMMGTWFPKHVVEKSNTEEKWNKLHKTVILLNSFFSYQHSINRSCNYVTWNTEKSNIKTDLRETDSEGGRWTELTQNCVKWRNLVLAVLYSQVLLPED
jgi:hypothetical protein